MSNQRKTATELAKIASEQFGYEDWRPGQLEAIRSILDGKDTLAVMPTGSGKSAIYQMAAFLMPGCTIVVSPLLALQRDQANTIAAQSLGDAAVVNSAVPEADRQEAFEQLESGDLEFLFLAPEQFSNSETFERLQAARPSLFVIDEAHCISAWGHDFRPDYLRLGQVIEALGHPRILALTATASPLVQTEIVDRLKMKNAAVLVQGFDRPNLWLGVERFEDEAEKQDYLLPRIVQANKPGLVYVAARKRAEMLAQELQQQGVRAEFYHAGLKSADRKQLEAAFMADELEVLVATTAFGMGIDKSNVRFVFHADISDSIDAYYQEIGRAGRDGEAAQAILHYNPSDLNLHRFLGSRGQVQADHIAAVLIQLGQQKQPIASNDLQKQTKLSKAKLNRVLNGLIETNQVTVLPTGEVQLNSSNNFTVDFTEQIEQVLILQQRRQQFDQSRLERMRGYAEVRDCRRKYILSYFGESFEAPCGNCDNCKAGLVQQETAAHQPYPLETRIVHKTWGEGIVMAYQGTTMDILFDQVGYKSIDVQTALLRQLIRRAESN